MNKIFFVGIKKIGFFVRKKIYKLKIFSYLHILPPIVTHIEPIWTVVTVLLTITVSPNEECGALGPHVEFEMSRKNPGNVVEKRIFVIISIFQSLTCFNRFFVSFYVSKSFKKFN